MLISENIIDNNLNPQSFNKEDNMIKMINDAQQCNYNNIENNNNKKISKKNDNEKSRVDLLPTNALIEIGKVLKYGAQKYGKDNWRYDFDWSRLYGAALRHLYEFWQGENNDPETNISHIAHAACNVLMLLSLILDNKGNDDRFINNDIK